MASSASDTRTAAVTSSPRSRSFQAQAHGADLTMVDAVMHLQLGQHAMVAARDHAEQRLHDRPTWSTLGASTSLDVPHLEAPWP